jgi:hypothetical protein
MTFLNLRNVKLVTITFGGIQKVPEGHKTTKPAGAISKVWTANRCSFAGHCGTLDSMDVVVD